MKCVINLEDVESIPSFLMGFYDKFMTAQRQRERDLVLARLEEVEDKAYKEHDISTFRQAVQMENILKKALEELPW